MAISASQIKYIENRLHTIAQKKKQQLKSEQTERDLSVQDKIKEIASGKATLKASTNLDQYTRLVDAFTYSNTKAAEKATKDLAARTLAVDEHYRHILDTVVLSDIKDVSALLADFESAVF